MASPHMFKTKQKKIHDWTEPLIKPWSYKRPNWTSSFFLDISRWWFYYNAFSLSQKNLKTLLSPMYDFDTKTSWITWEDTAEQPGLLAGTHSHPDKYWGNSSIKRQPCGHGVFFWKLLGSLWKIGFHAWTSHSRSGRSYALSSHLIPGFCGTACAPARACPTAGAAAWPLPLPDTLLLQGHCKTCCPWVMASEIATEPVAIWYLCGIFTVRLTWNWLV